MPNSALDQQDRNLFTQPRRDATTGELLPGSENVVDFAVRHGWTYDKPVWDDNAGLWVRLHHDKGRLDLWFYQSSLRTIRNPYRAKTAVGSRETFVCRPVPADIRQRVERFIVNPECLCSPDSYSAFHDDGPNPECSVHGEAK